MLLTVTERLVLAQILGCTGLLSHGVMTIECDGSHHKGESGHLGSITALLTHIFWLFNIFRCGLRASGRI